MSPAVWWRGLADGSSRGLLVTFLKVLLAVPALLYGMALRIRELLYRYGIFKSYRLPCPVISIGNLTVGGTGKTPATALIARMLIQQGKRVVVLSRGYGGLQGGPPSIVSDGQTVLLTPEQSGDEPYLLASSIPGLMVIIGADRYQAGLLALKLLKPDIVLLDDGFQHIRLQRDLNILLLDGTRPFGNGWTLPLGLLREPRGAMLRADLVIYTRCRPGVPVPDPGLSYCCSEHRLASLNRLGTDVELRPESLQGSRVAAFAGIADPVAFFSGLQQFGITPMATLALPDHATYGAEQVALLERCIAETAPDWLLTTEKDGVKLTALRCPWLSRVVTVRLALQLDDEYQLLNALKTINL